MKDIIESLARSTGRTEAEVIPRWNRAMEIISKKTTSNEQIVEKLDQISIRSFFLLDLLKAMEDGSLTLMQTKLLLDRHPETYLGEKVMGSIYIIDPRLSLRSSDGTTPSSETTSEWLTFSDSLHGLQYNFIVSPKNMRESISDDRQSGGDRTENEEFAVEGLELKEPCESV